VFPGFIQAILRVLGGGTPGLLFTGQKAVTTTAGALGAAATAITGIKLTNLSTSASPLFYGPAGVTASTGDELPAGASVVLTMTDPALVYLITASGTATASYALFTAPA
jgi:hypothetical protein